MSESEPLPSLDLKVAGGHLAVGRQRRPSDVPADVRLRRGVYVDGVTWDAATDRARYTARIRAVAATRMTDVVFSHESAAALLGIPRLGPYPTVVHATTPPASRRRSRAGVVWHHLELEPNDIASAAGLRVTSVARTLLDLARTCSFAEAVVSLDAGILPRGGPPKPRWDVLFDRVDPTTLDGRIDLLGAAPGSRRAAAAARFADGRSDSVGESLSRAQMFAWGIPAPEVQVEVIGASGRRYVADFAWNDGALLGEFDGRLKYSRRRLDGTASAEGVVWQEKRREDDLRATGRSVVRWTWAEAQEGHALARVLSAHGLRPTARHPRPIFTKGNS